MSPDTLQKMRDASERGLRRACEELRLANENLDRCEREYRACHELVDHWDQVTANPGAHPK